MKALAFLVLLLQTSYALNIYIKNEDQLQIYSNLTDCKEYYWSKQRTWKNGFDLFGTSNNCSLKKYYKGRIGTCEENLTISNMTKLDEGIYRLRCKYNKTFSVFKLFNVSVYDLQPVLSPTLIHKVKIHFWCGDLKNFNAIPSIEIRPVKNEYNAQLRRVSKHYWYAIIDKLVNDRYAMGSQYLFRTELRCCSFYQKDYVCGPWTFVGHHMYLSTKKNRGRPWCSYRGQHRLAGVSFDYNHDGPLFEPTCFNTHIEPSNTTVCENVPTTIQNISKSLRTYRQLGGKRRLTTGTEYKFQPNLNDSGIYFDSKKVFEINVKNKLYVALKTVKIHDNFIELKCEHTGSKNASVQWYIEGKYASYKIINQHITIYQDCWLDWDFWYYEFGVNCVVNDWPMQGYSRWLMGKVKRTNMLDNSLYG